MNFKEEFEDAKRELGITQEKIENENTGIIEDSDFIKVFKVNNKDVEFDFGILTGNKIVEAKKRLKKITKGEMTSFGFDEFDDRYFMIIAEMASGVPYNTLLGLKFKEYNAIKKCTRNFLLGISEEDTEEGI